MPDFLIANDINNCQIPTKMSTDNPFQDGLCEDFQAVFSNLSFFQAPQYLAHLSKSGKSLYNVHIYNQNYEERSDSISYFVCGQTSYEMNNSIQIIQ